MENNNKTENIEQLRQKYYEAQREYLEALRQDFKYKDVMNTIEKMDISQRCVEAYLRLADIEDGKVKPKDIERKEIEISILMASAHDELRKEYSKEQEEKEI